MNERVGDCGFEKITSRKNPKIISACALSEKKERDKTGLFAAEGIKLLKELISEKVELVSLFCTARAIEKYSAELLCAKDGGCSVFEVTDEVYDKLSFEKNPEGIFAVAKKTAIYKTVSQTPGEGGFVILERVQNPSNVGTVIRTAAALGVSRIMLTSDCADIFSPKTLRACMGAIFKVNILVTNDVCREIGELQSCGGKVYAAALDDDSADVANVSFCKCDSILIGNEGEGISEKTLKECSNKIIIPMKQNTESLNAAAAAAILIWEKQRGMVL